MTLTGLHFLLTYQCTFECEHCFVWGSPWQTGTFTLDKIKNVLRQAGEVGTIKTIYFEGGEPFLYYPILLRGLQMSRDMKFRNGIVTNGYWATGVGDAIEWLRPFARLVDDLSISSDLFHYDVKMSRQAKNAVKAATQLGIKPGVLNIAPVKKGAGTGEGGVMFRGRAADKLAPKSKKYAWTRFTTCPFENLRNPGRVHIDPMGNVHVCQGLTIGNLFRVPLKTLCENYVPDAHPVIGPLLKGGPVELAKRYGVTHRRLYSDACHLCYETRKKLRKQFPMCLTPDQMYGVA